MPSKRLWVTHKFSGGWGPDFGPTFYGAPAQDGSLLIPWLIDADNLVYEFDGGPHKAPGTTQLNATTLGATSAVKGVFDYWRQGTADTATQRVIAHVDTRIVQDTGGGVMANIATGLVSGAVPHYSTFDDFAIITSDAIADVPRSWDQTTFQNLAGSPPNFSWSVPHKNRQWAGGVFANPSRLYYSAYGNPEDWTGAGSGSMDINLDDGDMLTGAISHKDSLFVFKGPNIGSITRILGSTPEDFTRVPFIYGLGAAWINGIFRFSDDVGFLSPRGTVHSLAATASFGDFNQASLSYPFGSFCESGFNHSRLRHAWAVNHPGKGIVLITFAGSGSTDNSRVLMMDYRWLAQGERYPRWSLWTSYSLASLALALDTNRRPRMFGGNYVGRILRMDQTARSNNGTAIAYKIRTPWLTYGSDLHMKTLHNASIGIRSKNSNNMTLQWQRDNNAAQTQTVAQGGGSVWGPSATGAMVWGTGLWGGGQYTPRFLELEEGGEFRSVSYQVTDSANNSDIELHSLGAGITVESASTEN